MDEARAAFFAGSWSGGRGLVPRGPTQLLGWRQVAASDIERYTGRRPPSSKDLWRLEVGGRFLASGGLVYPGGIPFPEELQRRTAIVTSEVWLFVDAAEGSVIGMHWWPEAVRRPVASVPRAEFNEDDLVPPEEIARALPFPLRLPEHPGWTAVFAARTSPREAVVFCVRETVPDPLNEMLLYEQEGLTLRARTPEAAPDLDEVLLRHQPPFRAVRVGARRGVGREPGRALGPQTWPWPGELMWAEDEVSYELKGLMGLGTLEEVARSLARAPA